jgi:phosphonate C-P lyase system protein PhnH
MTITDFTRLAAACRLDSSRAERVFRSLMDTLARPGLRQVLEVPEGLPAVLTPLLALCDLDTTVAVVGPEADRDRWESFVAAVTGARRAPVTVAGWVVALGSEQAQQTLAAYPGTPESPEQAARLFLAVDRIHPVNSGAPANSNSTRMQISGPGVRGIRQLAVDGLDPGLMLRLDRVNEVHPAGLDAWLVDPTGTIVGLPRTLRITAAAARVS